MVRNKLIVHLTALNYSACQERSYEALAEELSKTLKHYYTGANVLSALAEAHPEEHAAHLKRVADLKDARKEQKALAERKAKELQEIVEEIADKAKADKAAYEKVQTDSLGGATKDNVYNPPSKEIVSVNLRLSRIEDVLNAQFKAIRRTLRELRASYSVSIGTDPTQVAYARMQEYLEIQDRRASLITAEVKLTDGVVFKGYDNLHTLLSTEDVAEPNNQLFASVEAGFCGMDKAICGTK